VTGLDLLHAALPGHDAFVVRAARYLAGEVGVRQFLDLGSGISDSPPLHVVVGQIIPTARVLYATDNPTFLAYVEAQVDRSGPVDWYNADLRDPAAVLERAGAILDLTEPVAVLLTGVLHLMDDAEVDALVSALVGDVVTESHVVISHLARDLHPGEMDALRRHLNETTPEVWTFRSCDQVCSLFAGVDVVDPGVVQVDEWRPSISPHPPLAADVRLSPVWVGVGRKP
jgi:hypothetical protein